MKTGSHPAYVERRAGGADTLAFQHANALDTWENEGGALAPIDQARKDREEPA